MGVSDISDVFISYRRLDVDFVKQIVSDFQELNKEVWVDWEDIPPGSVGFTNDIKRGIEGADTFLAVLSPDYLESTYCIDMELNYAIQLNKKVIPIVYRKFDEKNVPAGISHINWIYFTPHAGHENTFEEAFPKIIAAMETDLEHQRTHKRFLLRAIEWDENQRGNSYLLSGAEIVQAEQWLADSAGKDPLPSTLQKDYIATSRARATQVQRRILIGVSAMSVLMLIFAIFALLQWNNANRQREIAENERDVANSLALASGARERNISNRIESVGLAMEAINEIDNPPYLIQRYFSEIAYQPGATRGFNGIGDITNTIAIHPDGTIMAAGTEDNRIILFDMVTSDIITTLEGHTNDVLSLAFSPDGQLLASGGNDDRLIVWNTDSFEPLTSPIDAHSNRINTIAFHADGTRFATGSSDRTVIIWDATTQEPQTILEMPNRVFAVDFHPQQNQIAIGTRDSNIYLWDLDTEEEILIFEGHVDDVTDLAFSPDGSTLISVASDRQINIWDASTGTLRDSLGGHSRLIRTVSISPNSEYFVTGGDDRTLILWDLEFRRPIFQASGLSRVLDSAFTPDSQHFIIADNSTIPTEWTSSISGAEIDRFIDGTFDVLDVAISPDGTQVASGAANFQINRHNLNTGERLFFLEHTAAVTALAYSPDGTRIASADNGGIIHVWDTETQEIQFTLDHEGLSATSVAYTPDGQYIVTGGGFQRTAVLILWDAQTGDKVREYDGHIGMVRDMDISPDSTLIAAAEEGDQILIWNLETGEVLQTLSGHTNSVRSVAFSPDGTQLVSASFDQSLILWNVAEGRSIQRFFGHSDVIRSVDFHPNGEFIISAGSDLDLLLWPIGVDEPEPLRVYQGHTDNVTAVTFSDTGNLFASGSADDSVIVWRYDTLDQLQAWVIANRYIPPLSCNTQRQFAITQTDDCIN